jgi:hypothetical protein
VEIAAPPSDEYYINHDYFDHGYNIIGHLDINIEDNFYSYTLTTPFKASVSLTSSTTLRCECARNEKALEEDADDGKEDKTIGARVFNLVAIVHLSRYD